MKDKLQNFIYNLKSRLGTIFYARQGMDELSKLLFWVGLAFLPIGTLLAQLLTSAFGGLIIWIGLLAIIISFVRAFSKNRTQRELENRLFISWLDKRKKARADAKDRRAQKEYKFFKCPGCGTWVRVPKGKGKIHINCRCGYTLYRKT